MIFCILHKREGQCPECFAEATSKMVQAMTPQPNTQEREKHSPTPDLQELFGEFLSAEAIEKTKEDLDTQATLQILIIATILRELQSSTDEHANDLAADGFELRAEEAKQRAEEYERAYLSLCRVWPTEIIELLFEDEDKDLNALRAELKAAKERAEALAAKWCDQAKDMLPSEAYFLRHCANGVRELWQPISQPPTEKEERPI
jgi:hypothetical protein